MKKYIKIFLLELVLVLIVFTYIFNSKKNKNTVVNYDSNLASNRVEYNEITVENDLFNKLEKGLLNGDSKVRMELQSIFAKPDEIFSVLEDISYENPEVMYYRGAEYSFGRVKLSYSRPLDVIKSHQMEIRDKRDVFFQNNIKEDMSEYEKVLAIHDYILENGRYDARLYSKGEVPPESYSAYGILGLGVGVCESYAKSMKYLLDKADIESMIVIGSSKGENHAWNLVNIEDEYYHIDPTWNDPIIEDGTQIIRYNFLNLSDDQIERTHSWNREDYPEAKASKYNYYNYNKLTVLGKEELKNKLTKALINQEAEYSIKVLNFDKNMDISNIIEDIGYKKYEQIMLKSYSYYIDEEQGIISFQFYYY